MTQVRTTRQTDSVKIGCRYGKVTKEIGKINL